MLINLSGLVINHFFNLQSRSLCNNAPCGNNKNISLSVIRSSTCLVTTERIKVCVCGMEKSSFTLKRWGLGLALKHQGIQYEWEKTQWGLLCVYVWDDACQREVIASDSCAVLTSLTSIVSRSRDDLLCETWQSLFRIYHMRMAGSVGPCWSRCIEKEVKGEILLM